MTTYMYCLYVGVDYTYIDINALAHGIKSFFGFTGLVSSRCWGSNLWHRLLVSHANHSATETYVCMYVRTYVCMYVYVCMYACMCVCIYVCVCMYVCTYVRMYVRMYVRTCVCVCICMYVFKKYEEEEEKKPLEYSPHFSIWYPPLMHL